MAAQRPMPHPILQVPVAIGLLIVACLSTLAGCGSGLPEPARKLVGTWELVQPERLAERINQLPPGIELPAAEPDEPVADEDATAPTGPGMVLEFRADGTLRTRTALGQLQQQKQGTWRFVSVSADGQKLAVRCVLNQQASEVEVDFVEPGVISLAPPNLAGLSTKLRFRRAQ